MENNFKYIDIQKNGVVYYDPMTPEYTREEVDKLNKEYYARQQACIPEILADGFVEFPVLWDYGSEPMWSNIYLPPNYVPSCTPGFEEMFGLKYNIYSPTWRREGGTRTNEMLERYGIKNYYMCMEADQYHNYKEHISKEHIIIVDSTLKSDKKIDIGSGCVIPDAIHGTCGSFSALLYIAKALGEKSYWTMDDDIYGLGMKARKGTEAAKNEEKYDKNNYYRCSDIKPDMPFKVKETLNDMCHLFDKMRNQSFMSIEKYGLVFSLPISLKTGTRSYSFYLTNVDKQVDHSGRQNSDIITSLEMSKHGLVNVIVEGIIQYNSEDSQQTQGGTTSIYKKFGTLDKGKVLCQLQPNYSKISNLYSRIHHVVDFSGYNKMRLLGAVK